MAKLWPSLSSTVVVALRNRIDGIVVPEIVTALVKSSSLTSGLIDRLIIPLLRTVGRNRSSIPKSLNSIVGVERPTPLVIAIGLGFRQFWAASLQGSPVQWLLRDYPTH